MKQFRKVFIIGLAILMMVTTTPLIRANEGNEGVQSTLDVNSTSEANEETTAEVPEENDGTTTISSFEITSANNETEFINGKEIVSYVEFEVSATSETVSNLVIDLQVPAEFLESAPVASNADSVKGEPTVELIDGVYHIRYTMNPVSGGTSVGVPFSFKFKVNEVASDTELKITGTIKNSEGIVVKTGEIVYVNKVKELKMEKGIQGLTTENSTTTFYIDDKVFQAGKVNPNDDKFLSNEIGDLKPISFRYKIPYMNDKDFGNRKFESVLIEDTLPEGAVFLPDQNPGWSYNPVTRVASHTYIPVTELILGDKDILSLNGSNVPNSNQLLKLYFPNGEIGKNYTNNMKVTFTPTTKNHENDYLVLEDGIDFKLATIVSEDPNPINPIVTKSRLGDFSYYDYKASKTSFDSKSGFLLRIKNDSSEGKEMENITLRDHALDSAFYFQSGSVTKTGPEFFVGTVNIFAKLSDGTVDSLYNDVDLSEDRHFDLHPDTVEVVVMTTPGSKLKAKGIIEMRVKTAIRDHDLTVNAGVYRYNSATGSGKYTDSDNVGQATQRAVIYHYPFETKARVSKVINDKVDTNFVDDVVSYTLDLGMQNILEDSTYKMSKVVDLIPNGMNYVPGSTDISLSAIGFYSYDLDSMQIEPTIINNFKGTGQTALIWDLNDVTSKVNYTIFSEFLKINYELKVSKYTSIGVNYNKAYLAWDDTEAIKPFTGSTADIFDLNENGSVTDLISMDDQSITYAPPRELITTKTVRGSLDNEHMSSPNIAQAELDTEIEYKLNLYNNSRTSYGEISVVDVLPHIGDTTVSIGLGENENSQMDRNSEFTAKLNGPVDVPDGYKVAYSLEVPHYDDNDYLGSVEWFNELEDYSLVRALHLTLIEGNILDQNEKVTFTFKARVDRDYNLKDENLIVNTFGTSASTHFSSFESNEAPLKLVTYKVYGTVFNDFNNDQLFNDDMVFENHLVQLVNEDGSVVLDLEGNPIETMTKADGSYEFDVYRQGNYRIQISSPTNFDLITETPSDDLGSHIESATETTDLFTLNSENRKVLRNAGYSKQYTSLSLHKKLHNIEGEDIVNEELFEFVLTIDDELYSGMALIDGIETEIVDGLVYLNGGSTLLIEGLPKNVSYSVIENADDHYVVTPSDKKISGITDEQEVNLEFINVYHAPLISKEVTKVWIDGPAERPTIKVQLLQDGVEYGDVISLENGQTSYVWEDLPSTDINGNEFVYTVEEIDVPEGYESVVDGFVITNTFIIPLTPIEPMPPIPWTPLEPSKPGEEPTEPEKPVSPVEPTTPVEDSKLPNTGLGLKLPITGILTLGMGVVLLAFRKRESE